MGEQLQLFDDSEYIVEIDESKKQTAKLDENSSEDEEQEIEIRVLPGQLQMFRKLGQQ